MEIIRVNRNVPLPQRGTIDSVGFNCCTPRPVILRPLETQVVRLGFKMALPLRTWGLLKERSSMATREVIVMGGVIDADYRDEVMVILHNCGRMVWRMERIEQVCQLIVIPFNSPDFLVLEKPTLSRAAREGKFGSTGNN